MCTQVLYSELQSVTYTDHSFASHVALIVSLHDAQVLRSAGYFSHALWVASAAQQSDWMLDILLDDCSSYDEAIAFLVRAKKCLVSQSFRVMRYQIYTPSCPDMPLQPGCLCVQTRYWL